MGDCAPTAKMAEWLAAVATAPNQSRTDKANIAANVQIKILTDLIISLLRAIEEQKQTQINQIETLIQQIDVLRIEVMEIREIIQTQLVNIQTSLSINLSYANIAYIPPENQLSNLLSLSSINTILST